MACIDAVRRIAAIAKEPKRAVFSAAQAAGYDFDSHASALRTPSVNTSAEYGDG